MAETTKIAWADATFNPWIGCTKVSEGCAHCYAEQLMDHRYHRVEWGKGKPRKKTSVSYWKDPLTWNRRAMLAKTRRRVFCASLADVFDEEVPPVWRVHLFELIDRTPWLDWMLLTKRPENVAPMLRQILAPNSGKSILQFMPLPNVWLGTSVESGDYLHRADVLLDVPAVVHFISAEPLLGSLLVPGPDCPPLSSLLRPSFTRSSFVRWVILGGESESAGGPRARACQVGWVRDALNVCWANACPVFVKQLGDDAVQEVETPDGRELVSLPLRASKGGEVSEWPEDLRVRELPTPGPSTPPRR